MKLKDIKTAHLQKIINDNKEKTRTCEQFKMTVSQIFKQAIINDILVRNPADGLNLHKAAKKHTKRALTEDETARIKTLDLDPRTKCFVYLLLYTGMRRGEALALTKNDIDLKIKKISVNKALIFKKNQSEIKPSAKTDAGNRTIPLLTPLEPILRNYMDLVSTDLIFTTRTGETVSLISYRRMWNKFEKAMGTKDITAHIFRHNFASILYSADVDVKSAQEIMGHKSIKMMMDIYTHLDEKHGATTAQKLNDFLKM
jgi:integrase